jgi:hypothetical protein
MDDSGSLAAGSFHRADRECSRVEQLARKPGAWDDDVDRRRAAPAVQLPAGRSEREFV